MDPLTLTAISSGVGALGQAFNIGSTGRMNRKNREFTEKMYYQQMGDNRLNWKMQNEYNHPLQQMQRLRQAGLNPNLVYGKGAETTAGAIASTSMNKPSFVAPQVDTNAIISPMMQYFNMDQKQQQTDNLEKQNALLDLKKTQMELGITNQEIKNSRDALTTSLLKDSYKQQLESFILKNEGQRISNEIGITTRDLAKATQADNIKIAHQDLLNKQVQETQMKIKNEEMKLNNKLIELKSDTEKINQEKIQAEIDKIKQDLSLYEQRKQSLENTNYNLFVKGEYDNLKYQLAKLGVPENSPYFIKAMMTQGVRLQDQLLQTGKFDRDVVTGKKKNWMEEIYDKYNPFKKTQYGGKGGSW